MTLTLTAIINTGSVRYEKPLLLHHMRIPIWKLCTDTMKQLESEQYILQKGFKKI